MSGSGGGVVSVKVWSKAINKRGLICELYSKQLSIYNLTLFTRGLSNNDSPGGGEDFLGQFFKQNPIFKVRIP